MPKNIEVVGQRVKVSLIILMFRITKPWTNGIIVSNSIILFVSTKQRYLISIDFAILINCILMDKDVALMKYDKLVSAIKMSASIEHC